MSVTKFLHLRQLKSFAFVAMAAWIAFAGAASAQTVGQIVVQGNQRVEAETVRSYLSFRTGEAYTAAKADESLKTLYATGLFSDVNIQRGQGGGVIVSVRENQLLNRVVFEGNKKIKRDDLLKEIESQPRTTYTRGKAQADVQRIIDVYRRQGRFDVKVEPKIVELGDNRVDLVFEIIEGDRTKIEKISFIGNQAFSDGSLKDVITTSESNWLSWLKSGDVYDPERLSVDQELLRRHYLRSGYADFRVISAVADYDRDKNAFFITFTVEEGDRYAFGAIDIESNVSAVNVESVRSLIKTSSGAIYNAELIDKTVEEIGVEIAKRGYPFAQVRPRGDRDPASHVVNVTYVVEEGARIYVERINVRGNTRTMDKVIRREIELSEGDAFNRVLMDRAEKRLNKIGYFKKVNVTREPGSAADRIVLNVNVEEQSTGEISFGAGYATNDGLIANIGISEKNFLGRGQYVSTSLDLGERRRNVTFSFTEPYFLDRRLAAGFDVFYKRSESNSTSSFSQESYGAGVRLGVLLLEDLTFQARVKGYQQNIDVDANLQDCAAFDDSGTIIPGAVGGNGINDCLENGEASRALIAAQGSSFISSFGGSLIYNRLDNNRSPKNGYLAELNVDYGHVSAGGGNPDVDFIRTTGDLRGYYNFYGDFVGMLRAQGGNITAVNGGDVRLVDSFFKGGEFIRGFANSGIGPRDVSPGFRSDALGGTTYFGATAEIQFPIPGVPEELGIKAALFADAGTLFDVGDLSSTVPLLTECPAGTSFPSPTSCYFDDASIRSSVGLSLLWTSPLGPIRFDFGIPLSKEDYDRTQVFRFSGGTTF